MKYYEKTLKGKDANKEDFTDNKKVNKNIIYKKFMMFIKVERQWWKHNVNSRKERYEKGND